MSKEYTRNWSRPYYGTIKNWLEPLAGKPLDYLEIGLFEGRSMQLMMDMVLTHEDCRAWGVDPWTIDAMNRRRYPDDETGHERIADVERRARANLAEYSDKLIIVKERSQDFLMDKPFEDEFFDIVYIDGIHTPFPCLQDTVLTWPLLKVGGLLVWDDYGTRHSHVSWVVDAFENIMRGRIEMLEKHGQAVARRIS